MKNAVLFPTPGVQLVYTNDPRFKDCQVFYVSDGPDSMEGHRFKDIWISWWCFEVEGYAEFVQRIMHIMSFANEPGMARLF